MGSSAILSRLRRELASYWVRESAGPLPRGWVYGVFALLIAAGFLSLALLGSSALPVGLFAVSALYGVGASVYLMTHYARQFGVAALDGVLHPKHGILSGTPKTWVSAVLILLVMATVAVYGIWLVLAPVGTLGVSSDQDRAVNYVFGVSLLVTAMTTFPGYMGEWYVVWRWRTPNPPDHVVWSAMVVGSGLGLLLGWLTVQWALSLGAPELAGWFPNWVGWLPTGLVCLGALFAGVRKLMISTWQARVNEQKLRADAAEQARALAESQLAMMQAQVEPHFLYNTLASVQYLVRKDSAAADFLLTQLIRYLRHAMPKLRQSVSSLAQEFELADAYLQIARLRMGGRLTVQVELAERLHGVAFPPLVVQTLVENALKHGVQPKLGPVHIDLGATFVDGVLSIEVVDNGVGLGRAPTAGSGTGLANIRGRLSRIYGEKAQLVVQDLATGGVRSAVLLSGQSIQTPQAVHPETDTSSRAS